MELLRITFENAKLKGIWHYSLPSGYSCPGAKNCYTKADRVTGKITDLQTPNADGVIYRCYAAMDEARRPNVRAVRWDNFDLLKERKSQPRKKHFNCQKYSQLWLGSWRDAACAYRRRLLFAKLFQRLDASGQVFSEYSFLFLY